MAERKEATLISRSGSVIELTFSNAVKAGDDVKVSQLLAEQGVSLLTSEVSFNTTLSIDTRLTPPIIRKQSTVHRMESESSIAKGEKQCREGIMTVTPFHLGLLARHRHIIKIMLEAILEEKDPKLAFQWMEKVLNAKTALTLPDQSVSCGKDTVSMNGMNAFHVAARYHSQGLKEILKTLQSKHWIPGFKYLLDEKSSSLLQTPLHIAAKQPTEEATRCQFGIFSL